MADIPFVPMLARSASTLPRGERWLYEPKWDGFRALVHVTGAGVHICGRNGGSLDHAFPDVAAAVGGAMAAGMVLDGEVVVFKDDRLDFAALLRGATDRMPATFIAFDLLRHRDEDVRALPLEERRRLLERSVPDTRSTCVTAQTDDIDVATSWFEELAPLGVEGVVAKQAGERYRSGKRGWIKVRRFETLDTVVGGYRSSAGTTTLLLGLYDRSGHLHYIGHTTSLPHAQQDRVERVLDALSAERSFTGRIQPGSTRWERGQFDDWVPVEPVLVCEVAYSRMDHGVLRHPARVIRWRPDKDAKDCTVAT